MSGWATARETASDVIIATALLWIPIILLGVLAALVRLVIDVP